MPSSIYKRKSQEGAFQASKKTKTMSYGNLTRYGTRRKSWKSLYMTPSIHRFTRLNETSFTMGANGFTDGVATSNSLQFEFSLSGIQYYLGGAASNFQSFNPAELTTLFDMYRIDAVEICVMMNGDPNTITTAGALPRFYIYNDYDDASSLGNIAQVQQQQGTRVFQPGAIERSFKHWVRPKLLTQTYRTAVTTGYAPAQKAIWVDCNQDNVPHYGTKIWATGTGVTGGTVTFSCRLYVSLKQQA